MGEVVCFPEAMSLLSAGARVCTNDLCFFCSSRPPISRGDQGPVREDGQGGEDGQGVPWTELGEWIVGWKGEKAGKTNTFPEGSPSDLQEEACLVLDGKTWTVWAFIPP